MGFVRPVPDMYPVTRLFGEVGEYYKWHLNQKTGLWIKGRQCSICQTPEPCSCLNPHYVGNHQGVDFGCPEGTPVSAMTGGMIVRVGRDPDLQSHDAGLQMVQLVIEIDYDSWWITYRHLREILEKPTGRRIKAGDRIGYSGYTGCGAPFLHVEFQDRKMQWHPIPYGLSRYNAKSSPPGHDF